jgi:hypothetical protein
MRSVGASAFKTMLGKNKQLIIGLLIGLVVAIPIGAYALHDQNKSEQATNLLASNQSKDGSSSNPQSQTTGTASASTSASNNTGGGQTTTKPSSSSTSPSPATSSSTPTPSPTPTPDPTELTTCIWQNGLHINQYCPYSPPSSWSSDFITYPCINYSTSATVPCPNYREFTAIDTQGYSTDTRGLCQFIISSKSIHRNVLVVKAFGNGLPDCLTALPI